LQQDQRQATQAQSGASAPAAASPLPASGGADAASPPGDDQPINLFEAAAQAGRSGGSGGARSGGGASAAATAGGLGNLDFLRNNPQFQQLRSVVQQQPQMLEPILQQVGAGNPQLAQLIGQNPDQFLQLLSEESHDDEDNPLPPGAQTISVTEEEREAIERVCYKLLFIVLERD
jgi:UV excision repair protein RAD23